MKFDLEKIMNAKGSFRNTKWDFGLRVYQIGAVIATYYSILGTVFLIFGYLWRMSPSLELIFNTDIISFKTNLGLLVTTSYLVSSVLSSVILLIVVTRAKSCLDFSVSITLFHIIFVTFFNLSFPKSLSFWILMLVTSSITCVGGEYLCINHELKEIPLISSSKRSGIGSKAEKESML